jgi:hypothetical protein
MAPVPFNGLEIVMTVAFVAGLVWLVLDIAINDIGMLKAMWRDTEAFAREPAAPQTTVRTQRQMPAAEPRRDVALSPGE